MAPEAHTIMKLSNTSATDSAARDQTDVLIVCEKPLWPQDQGFRVHGFQMALALQRMGLRVAIASMEGNPTDTPDELRNMLVEWPATNDADTATFIAQWKGSRPGTWLRRRVANHQGLPIERLAGALTLTRQLRPQAVIGVGMHSVMMLRGVPEIIDHQRIHRAWYAADELVYFNLTCLPRESLRNVKSRLRTTALHLALERAFAPGIDSAIAVSPMDASLLRHVAGARHAITIRNGVDLETFTPSDLSHAMPRSLVFWGRMDFEPNADAVRWFAREVWPLVLDRYPDATWNIVGKNPRPDVIELNNEPGIHVVGGVNDVKTWARSAAVTILPMRCGGGIKNKLLEAAAMGLPIVASPRAVHGLELGEDPPMMIVRKTSQWVEAIDMLWSTPTAAAAMGAQARAWVERYHHWDTAASKLAGAIYLKIAAHTDQTRPQVMPINSTTERTAVRRAA